MAESPTEVVFGGSLEVHSDAADQL